MRTIAFFCTFFFKMCSPVRQFFEIVRNFLEVLPGHVAGLKIGYRTSPSPDPDPKSDPNPSPEACLPGLTGQKTEQLFAILTRTQQQAATCAAQVAVPWLAAPEYRTIVRLFNQGSPVKLCLPGETG